jgi:PKD repeat protein
MKLRLIIALILGFTASLTSVFAQKNEFSCGHSELQQKLWDENPQMKADFEAFLQNAKSFDYANGKKRTKYVIPVVFHIIHEYGDENISDAQVLNQMEILNEDFNKLNADTATVDPAFKELIANCGFEFKLATKDAFGNCTNGINHIYSHLTNNASDNSKLNQWDRSKYMNVWIVNTIGASNVAGYAYFPDGASQGGYYRDGIILKHEYIGEIGTSNKNRSRALTHEIGHYLGLPHVWGNGDPEAICGDDGIEDTPKTKGYRSCPNPSLANPQTCLKDLSGVFTLDSVKVNSGTSDLTKYNFSDSVKYSNLIAAGVSSNSEQSGVFSFSNWVIGGIDKDSSFVNQTGSIDLNKYYEFKIQVNKNHLLNLSKIVFKTLRDSNGVKSIAVRSSIDNFNANLSIRGNNSKIARSVNNSIYIFADTTKSFVSTVTLPTNNTFKDLSDNELVTFRIYAWNAEKPNGTFGIDSLSVQGVTGAIENIENYMEYSYCSKMFTKKQAALMTASLLSPISNRSNLHTAKNLEETGVLSSQTCKPIADFNVNLKKDNSSKGNLICKGSVVKFNDQSWGATVKSRSWTFEGGSPETSTDANPEVVYTSAGYKKVTLIATNDNGSDTLAKDAYIYVSENAPYYDGAITEGFENGLPWHWIIENKDSRWKTLNSNGKGNTGAIKLQNYKNISKAQVYDEDFFYYKRLAGSKQSLITPAIDLSIASDVNISFDYSFATNAYYDSLITESVKVYTSSNCGETWTLRHTIAGPSATGINLSKTLLTAGNFSGVDFNPNSDVLWKNFSIPLKVTSKDSNLRVKIEFEASEYSNNLFLDNISINGTLQIKESPLTAMDITVKPNPTSTSEGITINYTANNEAVNFELTDVHGKVIVSETNKTKNSNIEHTMKLDNSLNAGYYYLKITQGNYSTTRKVVVL